MKIINLRSIAAASVICGCLAAVPTAVYAAVPAEGPALSMGNYVAVVETEGLPIYVSMDSYDVAREAQVGESYQVLGDEGDGWIEVSVDGGVGYIAQSGVSMEDIEELAAEDDAYETPVQEEVQETADARRQEIVNFALQFVGCRYRYGGNDPHTGVDCSGFTRYVMQHAAGIALNRSSGSQVSNGTAVSAEQMRPGDLVFYGNGSRINHVALYIGDGQVVHASTYKTGVKTSPWTYRTPVAIVNVLGD